MITILLTALSAQFVATQFGADQFGVVVQPAVSEALEPALMASLSELPESTARVPDDARSAIEPTPPPGVGSQGTGTTEAADPATVLRDPPGADPARDGSAGPPAAAPPAPGAPVMESLPLPVVRIEMRASGDDPHAVLRTAPSVGTRQRIELIIENLRNRIDESGTRALERPLPFRTQLIAEVVAVDELGTITIAVTVESSVAQPSRSHTINEAQAMRAAASAMVGLGMELRVTATGLVESTQFEVPRVEDDMHAETAHRQALRVATALARLVIPVPDAGLGTNAVWRSTIHEVVEGVQRTQTSEFTLERVVDGVAQLSRKTHVSAPPQAGNPDMVPGAPNVQLNHHTGFGEGEIVRATALPFPTRFVDELICTTMATGHIAGERIIAHEQIFGRVKATATTVEDDDESRPRRRVGD